MVNCPEAKFKLECAALRVNSNSTLNGEIYFKGSRNFENIKLKQIQTNIERMKGNQFKKGKKESAETKAKKKASMAQSKTIGRWKRTPEYIESWKSKRKLSNGGKGERNAMASIENRQKVGLSKIGRKWFHNPSTGQVICQLPESPSVS